MRRIGRRTPPRLYIREWIDYLDLDQKRVAERMDCKEGTVSKLLGGQMKITQEWLAGFAEALDRENPLDLYRDPRRPSQNELLATLPPERQQEAIAFIEYLATKK